MFLPNSIHQNLQDLHHWEKQNAPASHDLLDMLEVLPPKGTWPNSWQKVQKVIEEVRHLNPNILKLKFFTFPETNSKSQKPLKIDLWKRRGTYWKPTFFREFFHASIWSYKLIIALCVGSLSGFMSYTPVPVHWYALLNLDETMRHCKAHYYIITQ